MNTLNGLSKGNLSFLSTSSEIKFLNREISIIDEDYQQYGGSLIVNILIASICAFPLSMFTFGLFELNYAASTFVFTSMFTMFFRHEAHLLKERKDALQKRLETLRKQCHKDVVEYKHAKHIA